MQRFLPSVARLARLTAVAMLLGAQALAQVDELEFRELTNALNTAYERIQALEGQLQGQGATLATRSQDVALADAAASAQQELEALRSNYTELRDMLEALGISAIADGNDEVADRLVAALNDFRLAEKARVQLGEALANLIDAAAEYSQFSTPANPNSALAMGEALEQARTVLVASKPAQPASQELSRVEVVGVKSDLGLVVLGAGQRDGIKAGMPFSILRGDRPIAKVLVVDVRNSVAGAVIKDLYSSEDNLLVGDYARADIN